VGATTRREHGERNDLFIIPPIIGGGGGDLDLQRILLEGAQGQPLATRVPKTERTIYGDGQNVHDTTVNNSVLDAAHELVKNHRGTGMLNFDYGLIAKLPPAQRVKVEAALHRITTDPSSFKHGTSLYSIFQSLMQFIAQHKEKDELNRRLVEELTEMSGLCATGHLARLVSVAQGFTDNDGMRIKMSIDDEVYAKIKHLADRAIGGDENSDDLLQDLVSPEKTRICTFLSNQAVQWINDLSEEYKDLTTKEKVQDAIIKALDKYTNTGGRFRSIMSTAM
jgi:hypothetical protein